MLYLLSLLLDDVTTYIGYFIFGLPERNLVLSYLFGLFRGRAELFIVWSGLEFSVFIIIYLLLVMARGISPYAKYIWLVPTTLRLYAFIHNMVQIGRVIAEKYNVMYILGFPLISLLLGYLAYLTAEIIGSIERRRGELLN